jgi:hypothetical protein
LKSFAFPFQQEEIPSQKYGHFEPGASRYDLWLRHGLHQSVTLEQLQDAITINPTVDVKLVYGVLGVSAAMHLFCSKILFSVGARHQYMSKVFLSLTIRPFSHPPIVMSGITLKATIFGRGTDGTHF